MMSKVRTFKIIGEIRKPTENIRFSKELRGLKQEEALERLYAELGSRHKAKRFEISITKIEEEKSVPEKTARTKA
jgi:ribosomal protein L20A (L18A)